MDPCNVKHRKKDGLQAWDKRREQTSDGEEVAEATIWSHENLFSVLSYSAVAPITWLFFLKMYLNIYILYIIYYIYIFWNHTQL